MKYLAIAMLVFSLSTANLFSAGEPTRRTHLLPAQQNLKLSINNEVGSDVFRISLTNTGARPITFKDFRSLPISRSIPSSTMIFVKKRNHTKVIHLLPNEDYSGYSFLIYDSSNFRMPFITIGPGEKIQESYSLNDIALGLFDKTVVQRKDIATYQYKLVTTIFVTDFNHMITAESKWLPFPEGFLDETKP